MKAVQVVESLHRDGVRLLHKDSPGKYQKTNMFRKKKGFVKIWKNIKSSTFENTQRSNDILNIVLD